MSLWAGPLFHLYSSSPSLPPSKAWWCCCNPPPCLVLCWVPSSLGHQISSIQTETPFSQVLERATTQAPGLKQQARQPRGVPKGFVTYFQLFSPGSKFGLDRLMAPANLTVVGAALEPCCLSKVASIIWWAINHNRLCQVWSTGEDTVRGF